MFLNKTHYGRIRFYKDVLRVRITYKKDGRIKYSVYHFWPFFNKKYLKFTNCTSQNSIFDQFVSLFPELTDFFRTKNCHDDILYILDYNKQLVFENEIKYNEFLKRYDDYFEERYC